MMEVSSSSSLLGELNRGSFASKFVDVLGLIIPFTAPVPPPICLPSLLEVTGCDSLIVALTLELVAAGWAPLPARLSLTPFLFSNCFCSLLSSLRSCLIFSDLLLIVGAFFYWGVVVALLLTFTPVDTFPPLRFTHAVLLGLLWND